MKIFVFCRPYLQKHKLSLAIYVITIIISVIVGILSPYVIGSFLDNIILGAGSYTVLRFGTFFGLLGFIRVVSNYFASMLYTRLLAQMAYGLNSSTITHIQNLSMTFSSKQDSAYINNRVNSDSNSLIAFCINILQNVLINAAMLIVPFFILFSMNGIISILMMGFLIIYIILYTVFKKPLYCAGFALKEAQSRLMSALLEQLKYIKIIKLNSIKYQVNKKTDIVFGDLYSKLMHNQKVNYLYTSMDSIISTSAQILLFVVGGMHIINGSFTIGMFTIFASYFNMMLGAGRYFFGLGAAYQNVLVAHNRMCELLKQRPEKNGSKIIEDIMQISLRGVKFVFNGICETTDCHTISWPYMNFAKGKLYAIAGVNGTGKSTLAALIMGMYIDEFTGEILYNGINIREIDMEEARRSLTGFAEQEPTLLNDSIKYNLTYNESIDPTTLKADPLLIECVQILNMQEFIDNRGYDYAINDKNTNTSGGEKQKIAILRLLYKNPDVMIFDEPTSAMDAMTTKRFIEHLCRIKKNKIIIVITHDNYIKSCCDHVLELGAPI